MKHYGLYIIFTGKTSGVKQIVSILPFLLLPCYEIQIDIGITLTGETNGENIQNTLAPEYS